MDQKLINTAWDEIIQIQKFVRASFAAHCSWKTDPDDLAQTWAVLIFKGFKNQFKGTTEEEVRKFIRVRCDTRKIDALREETRFRGKGLMTALGQSEVDDDDYDVFLKIKARTPAPDERAIIHDEMKKAYGNYPRTLLAHVLYAQGWKMAEIGEFFGVCEWSAWKYYQGLDLQRKACKVATASKKKIKTKEMIAAWREGLSLAEIGAKFGKHPELVRNTLMYHNVISSREETSERSNRTRQTNLRYAEFVKLWNSGVTLKDIARVTGFSYGTVRYGLEAQGIFPPKRPYHRKGERDGETGSLEASSERDRRKD